MFRLFLGNDCFQIRNGPFPASPTIMDEDDDDDKDDGDDSVVLLVRVDG